MEAELDTTIRPTPSMENQMEKKMEKSMETGIV